jgi:spore germination protein KC
MNHCILQKIIKFLPLLVLILSNLFLSGCWDRQELNDLAMVTAAGIDQTSDETIELSVLVYIPKGGGGELGTASSGGGVGTQKLVRSATGKTMAEAMAKLQELLPRHIFWGICKVFIIDADVGKEGIAEQVDFIMRYPQIRERTKIFLSKQKVKDILSLMPPLERDISEVLRELASLKIGMEVTTKDLAEMFMSDSGDIGVPWIKILPPEEGDKKNQTIAYITGTAIFKKDKLIGYIDDSVTRGVLWLRDEIEFAIITVEPKEANGYISINSLKSKSELVPKIEQGKWKITLKAFSEHDIVQNTTNLDMADPKVVKMLQKLLEKNIEERVELALEEVQKGLKADIFGFAEAFHREYPKVWKTEKYRWDEIYPDVEVKIDVKANIRRQGMNSVNPNFSLKEAKEE